jgi:hypothetical protein
MTFQIARPARDGLSYNYAEEVDKFREAKLAGADLRFAKLRRCGRQLSRTSRKASRSRNCAMMHEFQIGMDELKLEMKER